MVAEMRDAYLRLIEDCILGMIYQDPAQDPWSGPGFNAALREVGQDWPLHAHSMIGRKRMSNLRAMLEHVIAQDIPGDFIETGVWRGGACIFARAVFRAYGVTDRLVWVADSFAGLPPPAADSHPTDVGDKHHLFTALAISIEEVQENFRRYGLLDDQVRFLKGWFSDTLPHAPISAISVLRLDGDMYVSTMDALQALYDKVSPGGAVIVDDYHVVRGCKAAVEEFRDARGITAPIQEIDQMGVFWFK